MAIVYVSHRMAEIAAVSDRVTVLKHGRRVVTDGIAAMPAERLVRSMVGRDLAELFPPRGSGGGELLLEVRGGGNDALSGIDLTVRRGEIVGVAGGKCDALIVSPNTTAALTPAVEAACKRLPVVMFDRGVLTSCPVTFVNPVGGYGWGITTADFIVGKLPKGGKVLALRIPPDVDVLEKRWAAADRIFKAHGADVAGVAFTGGDNAKTKAIVEDYINRFGKIDAVWMDADATAVAALEAFEDAGQPYPIITGEDRKTSSRPERRTS